MLRGLPREMLIRYRYWFVLHCMEYLYYYYFYCYTDIDKFVYGFDITSLIAMLRKTRKLFNPYTRNPFTKRNKNEIIKMESNSQVRFSVISLNTSYKCDSQSLASFCMVLNHPVANGWESVISNPTFTQWKQLSLAHSLHPAPMRGWLCCPRSRP